MHPNNDVSGVLPPDVPTAKLRTIDLNLLCNGDSNESEKLFEACKADGVFYLDIRSMDEKVLDVVDHVYQLEKELYDLPIEEKTVYDVDKISQMKLNGYKPVGRNFGGLPGKKDGFETYVIPKDGVLGIEGQESFPRPPIIDNYMDTLREFTGLVHSLTATILNSLSSSLQLPPEESLMMHHRPTASSADIIRLLKYHEQPIEHRGVPHTPHTDIGSLTFLFTRQPGLQVVAADEEWTWVEPKEGHVVINLGDMMGLLTNNLLRSCLHRVSPLPGKAMPTRYSFAYMLRAEHSTPMTALKSKVIPVKEEEEEGKGDVFTSREWLEKKYGVLRLNTYHDNPDWMLTGQHKKEVVDK